MSKLTTLICISAAFLTLEASAQGGMGGGNGDRPQRPDFATLDTDANGTLTLEELNAMAADSDRDMSRFLSRMDADGDSLISLEEYSTRPSGGRGREE